jgi:hypothetical protein
MMPSPSTLRSRVLPGALLAALCALVAVSGILWQRMRRLDGSLAALRVSLDSLEASRSDIGVPVSPLLLQFQLDLPGRGEVFPAMAEETFPEYWPVAVLRITNTADRTAAQVISAEIPGWSRPMERLLMVEPRREARLSIRPPLLSRAHANQETRSAYLEVRVTGLDGVLLYAANRPILIHGGSEIFWGRRFVNAQATARWVTPHSPSVLELVARARSHIRGGRLAGYSGATGDSAAVARNVRDQARAVFLALRESGITYVNSMYVMGEHVDRAQRIRLPEETLRLQSANCMDVSVAFASAMENLGLQPLIVILPSHAVAGVRLGRGGADVLYLDLTVLPRGSFDTAGKQAAAWLGKTPPEKTLVVDVAATRVLGIYPLVPVSENRTSPADTNARL